MEKSLDLRECTYHRIAFPEIVDYSNCFERYHGYVNFDNYSELYDDKKNRLDSEFRVDDEWIDKFELEKSEEDRKY